MNITRPSSAEEYLASFWVRESRKSTLAAPPPEQQLEFLLQRWPDKFPFSGKRDVTWHVCRVSLIPELESLWMHKSDTWLEDHGLWRGTHFLVDLAKAATDTRFFAHNQDRGSCGKNYDRWKVTGLKGQLDGHEKPLLVQYPDYINIVDGFGRLLPYLTLVLERIEFQPFEAYFARPVQ
jgi:hypothetical protein